MIKEYKKNLGFVCPSCSSIVTKDVTIFDLPEKGKTDITCSGSLSCGSVCFTVHSKKDKYTISMDCAACGENHMFSVRKATFWQSDFFVLNCPETGIGVLFIGDENKVRKAIDEQEKSIMESDNPPIMPRELTRLFESIEHISLLAKQKKVYCKCGSHEIDIELYDEKIDLKCRSCGHSKQIPTDTESLKQLLNTSAIVLD